MKSVLFVGIDVGGWHGERDAVAIAQWRDSSLVDVQGKSGALLYPCTECLGKAVKLATERVGYSIWAVDAALAWPKLFVELINGASAASHYPSFVLSESIHNPYLYRKTEQFIYEKLGQKPLTAPGDKFGNNCSKAQSFVAWLKQQLPNLYRPPFDGWDVDKAKAARHTLIEVYPAASKRSHSFRQLKWPSGESMGDLNDSDLSDAKRCAMTAVCYAKEVGFIRGDFPETYLPTDASVVDSKAIRVEGWIFAPKFKSPPR